MEYVNPLNLQLHLHVPRQREIVWIEQEVDVAVHGREGVTYLVCDARCEPVLDVVAKHCTKGLGLDIGANVGAKVGGSDGAGES